MGWKRKVLIGIGSLSLVIIMLGLIFNQYLPFSTDFSTYQEGYELQNAFPELEFNDLVHLSHDGTDTLYAVEQEGRIYSFSNSPSVEEKSVFLDIRDKVRCCGETGLLGLTFDPNFSVNGYFYVDYTANDPLRTVISRFTLSDGLVDPNSELIILQQEQPYSNHNAGTIVFGPDNYLYITFGDGGSAGDPQDNGQNLGTWLGSILRINVSLSTSDEPYSVPDDNPFVNDSEAKPEIWAYGLRNPWKITFDAETGDLWAGDVGQSSYEEVDIIVKGGNYGWDNMEGMHCYEPDEGCDTSGLIMPVTEYGRDQGKSISGGYVYRGSSNPGLVGQYIYADYVTGRFWKLEASNPSNPGVNSFMKYNKLISGFGVDQDNELYVLEYDGIIHKIVEIEN